MTRVVLRAVEASDLPLFFAHQREPEGVAMAAVAPRDRPAFDAHWRMILADPAVVARTVVVDGESGPEVAGNAVSWLQDGRRLVGYWIGRAHWGRGVASAALAAFLGELPDRPLHAWVAAHNVASRRVLEKHGFEVEEPGPAAEPPEDGVEEVLMVLRSG